MCLLGEADRADDQLERSPGTKITLRAAQLGRHMTNHEEARRHVLQHLGEVFAQLAQRTAAIRTSRFLRRMGLRLLGRCSGNDRRVGFAGVLIRRGGVVAADLLSGWLALSAVFDLQIFQP